MVGVGEADSVAPIRERGTAVGLVEASDTEGAGGRDETETEPETEPERPDELKGPDDEDKEGDEDDCAFAKREEKRTVRRTSWRIDADILKNAFVAVVGAVDGIRKKEGGWRKRWLARRNRPYVYHTLLPMRQFQ